MVTWEQEARILALLFGGSYGFKWCRQIQILIDTVVYWNSTRKNAWPDKFVYYVFECLLHQFCMEVREMVTEIFALSGKDSPSFEEFRQIANSIASDGLPVWRGPFTFNINSPDTFLNKVILSRISYIREARSWGDTHLHFFDNTTKQLRDDKGDRRHG